MVKVCTYLFIPNKGLLLFYIELHIFCYFIVHRLIGSLHKFGYENSKGLLGIFNEITDNSSQLMEIEE